MQYDFDDFLNTIKYLDQEDILKTTHQQQLSLNRFYPRYTKEERLDLQNSLQGFLFWIETKQHPPGMSHANFEKLKPICKNLIKKHQLEPAALELFT